MFDLKKYSVKEAIEYTNENNNSLVIGIDANKELNNEQFYCVNNINYFASRFNYSFPSKGYQFYIKSGTQNPTYYFNYVKDKFNEKLDLINISFSKTIKANGTEKLIKKRYNFKHKKIKLDYKRNAFGTSYCTHEYTIKINRNKTTEHYIYFKETGLSIRENYNSKGMCTRSLLNSSDGSCLQLYYENTYVKLFYQDKFGTLSYCDFKLHNLKDASVLNLYANKNCFELNLMIPENNLYSVYIEKLSSLKDNVLYSINHDKEINPMLRTILLNIEEQLAFNETY